MAKRSSKKDYEETEGKEEKKKEKQLTAEQQKTIRSQVKEEYNLSSQLTQGKRAIQLKRLKLYNNQKRDQSKVGDPLLFTVFNTVFAELYNDQLMARFEGKEEGDDETAENLNAAASYDHGLMEKDQADYEWDWDTCFFGRGYQLLYEFDRKAMVPVAETIDPMALVRDPRAKSINGNQKGHGAARFFGREIGLTKGELRKNPAYFNVEKLRKDKDIQSLKEEATEARREAQNLQQMKYQEESLTENYEFNLLEWWTHIKGRKYLITTGNNQKVLVRFQKVNKDGEDDKWPVIDRVLFPMAHDFDGVSIPDLIEDNAYIDGPHGYFIIDDQKFDGIVMFAGGIGVAPMMSIIRQMTQDKDKRPVKLLYGNRIESQIAFKDELQEASKQINLEVDYVLSEPPRDWKGSTGFLDEPAILSALDIPNPEKWLYLLCGPPVMLDSAVETLKSAGIPKQQIIFEKFSYL